MQNICKIEGCRSLVGNVTELDAVDRQFQLNGPIGYSLNTFCKKSAQNMCSHYIITDIGMGIIPETKRPEAINSSNSNHIQAQGFKLPANGSQFSKWSKYNRIAVVISNPIQETVIFINFKTKRQDLEKQTQKLKRLSTEP